MRGSADPRGAMHIHADVARPLDERLARVERHSHADLHASRPPLGGDRPLRLDVHSEGVDRARERDEERIALGVDLEAVPFRERGAQEPALLGEQVGVFLPQAFQQPGRTLDVREQERDRAGRDGRRRLPEARVIGDAHMPSSSISDAHTPLTCSVAARDLAQRGAPSHATRRVASRLTPRASRPYDARTLDDT